jgi:predicted HNH restriction endonuclease
MFQLCIDCNIEKPLDKFYKINGDPNRRYKRCSSCETKHREANKTQEQKEKHKQWKLDWKRNRKKKLVEYKGSICQICNTTGHPAIFDFHHLDPTKKEGLVTTRSSYKKSMEEADKCILLCSNCHRLLHAGEVSYGNNLKDMIKFKRDEEMKICK